MRLIRIFICVSMVVVPGVARAQFTNPYTHSTWNNPISSSLDTNIYNSIQRGILERAIAAQGKTIDTAAKPAKTTHKAASVSDFTPAAKGHPTVDKFLASAGLDADQKAAFKQLIDATFEAVEKDLRKNNVSSALGFVIGTSVEIVNGKEISLDQGKELIAGINDLLAATPAFAKLKAKDRQEMYESLIMTGAILLTFQEAGKSDEAMKKGGVEMAQSVLAQLTGSKTAN